MVFAASSLTEVFRDLGGAFEGRNPGQKVTFHFDGTPTLRTQLEQGAKADVFATANRQQMEQARDAGIVPDAGKDFAASRLVVIVPSTNPVVQSLEDLAGPGVKLVLAQADVPIGDYARQSIQAMEASGQFPAGFSRRISDNIVSEESNVRQVAAKVALGEADAAFVYDTDVTGDLAEKVQGIPIPVQYNIQAVYPIAQVRAAPNPDGAARFIAFVLSEDGRAILAQHGFEVP